MTLCDTGVNDCSHVVTDTDALSFVFSLYMPSAMCMHRTCTQQQYHPLLFLTTTVTIINLFDRCFPVPPTPPHQPHTSHKHLATPLITSILLVVGVSPRFILYNSHSSPTTISQQLSPNTTTMHPRSNVICSFATHLHAFPRICHLRMKTGQTGFAPIIFFRVYSRVASHTFNHDGIRSSTHARCTCC